jgi:hypothetical protein
MKMMFVLEKRTDQKEGSLGIYVLKWLAQTYSYKI